MELRNQVDELSVRMFVGRYFGAKVRITLTDGELIEKDLSGHEHSSIAWILIKMRESNRDLSRSWGFISGNGPNGHGWSFSYFQRDHPISKFRKTPEKIIKVGNLLIQSWWDAFEEEIRSAPTVAFDDDWCFDWSGENKTTKG